MKVVLILDARTQRVGCPISRASFAREVGILFTSSQTRLRLATTTTGAESPSLMLG
jgi:hypothetical protein